ncbi:MAG: hypothetical protein ACRETL_17265, partial [Gammaproteobacteria bacterium]
MKWIGGVLAWLTFLVVMCGCRSNAPEAAVLVHKPSPSYLCHPDLPGFPGCECPPYCAFPHATPVQIIVTFAGNPFHGDDGDPLIIPWLTPHSHNGRTEPIPLRPDNGQPLDSTLTFTIEVDTNGHVVPSVPLHLAIDAVDSGGRRADSAFGHVHSTGIKPKGSLSPDTIVTTNSTTGKATVTYMPSQYSEPIHLVISSPAFDTTATKHWTVGVPGLVQMSGPYVSLVGEIAPHPHSHYVLPSTMNALNTLAAKWNSVYHTNLQLNDMSLRYGGKFDLTTDWRLDTAVVGKCKLHCEHRLGRSADINGLSPTDTVPYH